MTAPKVRTDFSKMFSNSRIAMFRQCPKNYEFYYLDPVYSRMKGDLKKQPQNIFKHNTLGKAVHNAITLFYYLPTHERNEAQLLEKLKITWTSEVMWNKKPPLGEWGGFSSLEEERESYGLALEMLKNFLKISDPNPDIFYLPTQEINHSIDDLVKLIQPLNETIDISGKFDLIINTESPVIIDFKTGKSESVDQFQLIFYKLLAEKNFNKIINKASFYYLRSGVIGNFDLSNKSTKEIGDEVITEINEILNCQNFEARPSKLCNFCLFKPFCPAKAEVAKILDEVREDDFADDLPF